MAEPTLTLEAALAMQEDLMAGYRQQAYQDALRKALEESGDDKRKRASSRRDANFEFAQKSVMGKYGFESSAKGVQQSLKAFLPHNSDPAVARNNAIMAYLTDPDLQQARTLEAFLEETFKQAPAAAQSPEADSTSTPAAQDKPRVDTVLATRPTGLEEDLVLRIVEIFGVEGMLQPTPKMLEFDAASQPLRVDGLAGWALGWIDEEESYLVQSFKGDILSIKPINLREYLPPSVEEGGFDAAWPPSGVIPSSSLGDHMARQLFAHNYCVLQMADLEEQRRKVMGIVRSRQDWECVIPEFEAKFMGRGMNGKISFIGTTPEEGELADLDNTLMDVYHMLSQYTPALGFLAGGRSKALLRVPFDSPAEQRALARGVEESDLASAEDIEHLLDFSKRGRICMLYILVSNGGTVLLEPVDPEQPSVELPFQQGRLLLINDDLMKYSIRPAGAHLVVQSWLMREALPGEELDDLPRFRDFDPAQIPKAPAYGESGELVAAVSMATLTPGAASSPEQVWQYQTFGADVSVVVPNTRWDIDFYWVEDGAPGKMYMRHFGMLCEQEWEYFDGNFFSISPEESQTMSPNARKCLENGYECLVRGGWNRKSLRNTEFTSCVGGTGNEYLPFLMQHRWDTARIGVNALSSAFWMGDAAFMAHVLHYFLGLQGTCSVADTACSSALTACAIVHSYMRPLEPGMMPASSHRQTKMGIAQGESAIFEPGFTIGLCGAHMLSHMGRCFTFDASGDGFSRGEGCASIHFQLETSENFGRLAILAGSNMNQDGRSASLTAPYGPSQIACMWGSIRETGISPFDIQVQELHGTGTALGDPIEVGALRAVMRDQGKVTREHPLVKTSAKSNTTHTETAAGIIGLQKAIMCVLYAVGQCGIHLRILNPHIDSNNYPVIFSGEVVDQGKSTAYSGVSSFGFGGSNARGDIWGMCTAGPRKVLDIGQVFDSRRVKLFTKQPLSAAGERGVAPPMLQAEAVKGWNGLFQVGNPIRPGAKFFLSGTWNSWKTMDEMHVDKDGVYSWGFRMGDTVCEEFRIHVDYFVDHVIFPGCERAGPDASIFGPGNAPTGYNWRIDGRVDGAKPGTLYKVDFWWDEAKREKRISWQIASSDAEEAYGSQVPHYEHRYSVKGTWTSTNCQDMKPVVGLDGMYETTVRLGSLGHEEFHFVRDFDENQLIYPAATTASRFRLPIRGPDNGGREKRWVIQGEIGELVTLRLRIREGNITVSIISDSKGELKWANSDERQYCIRTWDSDRYIPMELDRSLTVYTATLVMPAFSPDGESTTTEFFQILSDEDPNQAIYPEMYAAPSGYSAWLGPDDLGKEMYWKVSEIHGTRVEITFDLQQPDRRQAVTWKPKL